jgi:hypothetical protein
MDLSACPYPVREMALRYGTIAVATSALDHLGYPAGWIESASEIIALRDYLANATNANQRT